MWIRIPSTCCPSAPAAGDSISDSTWRAKLLARSAVLSTKHSPAKSWLQRWKQGSWMTRLFGRILKPSMADRGVVSWIASLEATRASHFPLPASVLARMMSDIYGQTLLESLGKLSRACVFSRTSQATLISDSIPFSLIYERWATELRAASLRRRKLAQATSESDCSSWATVDANTSTYSNGRFGPNLREQTATWRTPSATEADHAGPNARDSGGAPHLENQAVAMWPTPASEMTVGEDKDATWIPGQKPTRYGKKLQTAVTTCAKLWPTPSARDVKGTNSEEHLSKERGHHDQLPNFVAMNFPSSLPAPEQPSSGGESSKSDQTSPRRLNPRFVAWLMGWPPGLSSCDSSEMAASLPAWRSRSLACIQRYLERVTSPHDGPTSPP